MKIFTTLILFAISVSANAQYNFESCYEFWKLTDKLKIGMEPSEQEWESLKNTEGYKGKNLDKAYWNWFVEAVTLVYTPGNEAQVSERAKDDFRLKWIQRYEEEEDELKAYVRKIENLGVIDSATQIVRKYLPEKYQKCFDQPIITYLLLDYDANGTEQGIYMDLLVSYDLNKFKVGGFAAHEMFHYIVDKCDIKNLKTEVQANHKAAMYALDVVSEEGTSDLIDKSWLLFDPDSPYMLKDLILDIYHVQSAKSIEGINRALEELADENNDPYGSYAYWQGLTPINGHVPGMYMSRVIKNNGLEKELFEGISNPFTFYYLYNEAAKNDHEDHPEFSEKAIQFLEQLDSLYIK